MRMFADIVAGIGGVSTIAGFMLRRFFRDRRAAALTHREYQEKLRAENHELDDERQRLGL